MSTDTILIEIMKEQLEAKILDLRHRWFGMICAQYRSRAAIAKTEECRDQIHRAEDALWSLEDIAGH